MSFRRKPESRVPGENRDPVSKMVPGIRRDGAWMPAFAGMTNYDIVREGEGWERMIFLFLIFEF